MGVYGWGSGGGGGDGGGGVVGWWGMVRVFQGLY